MSGLHVVISWHSARWLYWLAARDIVARTWPLVGLSRSAISVLLMSQI